MKTLTTIAELRARSHPCGTGRRVGLVPTMGALHAGHVALLDAARAECDLVVASVFVNPAQFGEPADLDAYPRDLERRRARSPRRAASTSSSRPTSASSTRPASRPGSSPPGRRSGLEGEHRPGHFRGVATVCVKLFKIVRPDARLLRPQGCPAGRGRQAGRPRPRTSRSRSASSTTVRDDDGLALSSRNAGSRRRSARSALGDPARARDRATPSGLARSLAAAGIEPDYVEVADLDGPTLARRRAGRLDPPDRQHPAGRRRAHEHAARAPGPSARRRASCRCPSSAR